MKAPRTVSKSALAGALALATAVPAHAGEKVNSTRQDTAGQALCAIGQGEKTCTVGADGSISPEAFSLEKAQQELAAKERLLAVVDQKVKSCELTDMTDRLTDSPTPADRIVQCNNTAIIQKVGQQEVHEANNKVIDALLKTIDATIALIDAKIASSPFRKKAQ